MLKIHLYAKKVHISQCVYCMMCFYGDCFKKINITCNYFCCHQVSADSGRGSMVDGVINESDTTPKQKPKQRQSSPQQQQQSTPSSGGRTTRRRNHIVYEFDFPSELCGRLIGRNGKNINILKDRSGIEITIKRKPYTKELQVVCLEGEQGLGKSMSSSNTGHHRKFGNRMIVVQQSCWHICNCAKCKNCYTRNF